MPASRTWIGYQIRQERVHLSHLFVMTGWTGTLEGLKEIDRPKIQRASQTRDIGDVHLCHAHVIILPRVMQVHEDLMGV